jgi:NAD(P)H-dependent flavin oxidoreductase YrpB (nitropropane dioxygenase family)
MVQAPIGWIARTRLASAVSKSAQHIIEETVAQFFAITGRPGGLATAHRFG